MILTAMAFYLLLYFALVCSILPFLILGNTNAIRLQPNTAGSGTFGIIQVYYNGAWGTVCNDDWDMKDTLVACRQLCFDRAVGFIKYGKGQGQVFLNHMACTGLETSLDKCTHGGWGVSPAACDKHVHDIGVVCSSHTGKQEKNKTLRLQPGTEGFGIAGILQVYHNDQWGTVCSGPPLYMWDITDTTVACRQLGASKAVGYWNGAKGEGKVWMNNVRCTGQEKSLQDCNLETLKPENTACKDHIYDVGIVCSENNVRLVDGADKNEGRIEVKLKGTWGTVCGDYGWTIENSNVICRMLGHKRAITNQKFGAGSKSQPIWLQEVSCKGCEMSMTECQTTDYSLTNCSHENDVGVVCLPKGEANIAVRLAKKDANFILQVQVRYHGIWRSVCPNNWDLQDAHVICKMTGYQNASVAMATRKGSNESVWLDHLDCSGNETTIEGCKNVTWNWENKPCSKNLRAGVVCWKDEFKLNFILKGETGHAGKLEVAYYGRRGNLCITNLDLNAAHVICRMLRYHKAVTVSSWGQQSMVSFSLSLQCDGSESSIDDCTDLSLKQVDSCYNDEVAGIVCQLHRTEYSGKEELRLVGGTANYEGRVEVKRHGVWGTVCSDGWDMLDADVVCRMMGYKGAITASYKIFPEGSGPIWIAGLNCKGHENSTKECGHEEVDMAKSCSHKDDVGVICYSGKAGHLQVSLEIDNRSSLYNGREKIKVNNETGTIDDDQWDIHDAHVVCRMLKLPKAIAAISLLRREPGKVFFSKVRCNGTEESLKMCDHGGWGPGTQGYRGYDAGVICDRPPDAQAKMMDVDGSNDGAVTGLSIFIVLLIMVGAGACLWYFFKLRNNQHKDSDEKTQGLELARQVASLSDDVTDGY